jgi:hypothetical protein
VVGELDGLEELPQAARVPVRSRAANVSFVAGRVRLDPIVAMGSLALVLVLSIGRVQTGSVPGSPGVSHPSNPIG